MQKVKQSAISRRTGRTTVTTTAAPILQIGNTSGAGTTFTTTTAVDAVAWDLSDVVAGDVAATSDGCAGLILEVNDGTDTITVQGWYCPATGWNLDSRVEASVPADGSTITIHRRSHVRLLGVKADAENSDNVSIALNGAAVNSDYVLEPGAVIALGPEPPNKFLDVSQVYVIAASGSQTLHWIVGGKPGAASAITVILTGAFTFSWSTFVDGDTTPDISGGYAYFTNNSAPTTITDFDNPSGLGGQLMKIEFADTNTTIQASANIRLQGGIASPANDFGPGAVGDTLDLHWNGTQWVEDGRSLNS